VAGYGHSTVLRAVDLVAPGSRVTALIGANGAGKTTLLRVASGVLRSSAGTVTIDGEDVTRRPAYERVNRGLCYVPEGRAIFPSLTVRENLELHHRGTIADPVGRAVDAFPRLGERLQQIAGTMSGGEQQMLALSRAYISSPQYVLLDEVSMGLAPTIVAEIFDFMRKLAADGVGLLVVEQYVQHVLEIADLVYVLRKGEIVFAGQPIEMDADRLAEEYLGVGT
jgi:branched-chain amino acid transport system ATP-binding protein